MALPIAVLISGKGSNLGAILEAVDRGKCDVQVRAVLSDRPSAEGLALAQARGIPTQVVSLKDCKDRAHWDEVLADATFAFEPALVVLAGFMKLVGPVMIERFRARIINVHPSLLPLFPGTDGPEQALRAGVRITGCTVHLVDRGIDTGAIVAQAAVPVLPDDDALRLHARIQRAEHRLLPEVIDAVARGRIALDTTGPRLPHARETNVMLCSPALGDGSATRHSK